MLQVKQLTRTLSTEQEGKAIAANDEPILLEGEEVIESVERADSPGQMWTAIGQDSYSVVPIQSTLHPDVQLEGTRLTVVQPWMMTMPTFAFLL